MKYVLALLLLVRFAFGATTTTIRADVDTYADSTNRTFNYGSTVEYYIGNRTGKAETVMWVHFDYAAAGIPSNAVVSSAVCTLFCASMNSATTWYVRARLIDSSWVEGTGNGAYQNGSGSWNNQGFGASGVNGVTISTPDSCWGVCAETTIPPKGGAWSTAVIDSEVVTNSPDSFLVFDLASGVQAQLTSGNNFGFHFFGTSTTTSQRVVVVSSEGAEPTDHPRIDVTWTLPVDPDSTFMLISVNPPSAPLTDYPTLVEFFAYPSIPGNALTFYASDSTTKLYWCPDSMSTNYSRVWVIGDWDTDQDSIYVRRESNPSYMNCDSVFLLYEDFSSPFSISQPATDWSEFIVSVFDTSGPILTGETDTTVYADSSLREPSGVLSDWQESDSDLRYKYFYCGERLKSQGTPSLRYNDNFLMWASAPAPSGPWTKQDTMFYDSSGITVPIRSEDPTIKWFPNLSKWLMVVENHQVSDEYHVGLFYADSLDQVVWTFHGDIPLLEASALGQPTDWLDKEQASPAFSYFFPCEPDTVYMTFEAFGSSGNSYMGLAVSYDDATSGDTLGLTWHLCDSTGVVNDANPMPIVPWGLPGQPDSAHTIPDALFYSNGEYIALNHSAGPSWLCYKGDALRNLTLQTADSALLADNILYDTLDGNWLGTLQSSLSSNGDSVYLFRQRDFDTTRVPSAFPFTVHNKANKFGTHHRFWGGECYTEDGTLTMYPNQWMNSSLILRSKNAIPQGFILEMWSAITHYGDGTVYTNISIGDTVIQDAAGVQTLNGTWSNTQTNAGYTFVVHPNTARFYRAANGVATTAIGSSTTIDADLDTLGALHKWSISYTTDDSLIFWIDDVQRVKAKDVTYNGVDSYVHIAQGEQQLYNRGGVVHIDKIQVRKFDGAEVVSTATDTLYYVYEPTSTGESSGWEGSFRNAIRTSWRTVWK